MVSAENAVDPFAAFNESAKLFSDPPKMFALFAACVSNVPNDPGEHQKRWRPREQRSDDHRMCGCHDCSWASRSTGIPNSGAQSDRVP
jgi:hypothetical protein